MDVPNYHFPRPVAEQSLVESLPKLLGCPIISSLSETPNSNHVIYWAMGRSDAIDNLMLFPQPLNTCSILDLEPPQFAMKLSKLLGVPVITDLPQWHEYYKVPFYYFLAEPDGSTWVIRAYDGLDGKYEFDYENREPIENKRKVQTGHSPL